MHCARRLRMRMPHLLHAAQRGLPRTCIFLPHAEVKTIVSWNILANQCVSNVPELLTDGSSCMWAPNVRRMLANCGPSNAFSTQHRSSLNEHSIRHCSNTPALPAISRAAEFLGAAAGRRMHLVPRGHELFSAHLNPRKSQHCASVWQFASSAFCARPCSIVNRFALVWPTKIHMMHGCVDHMCGREVVPVCGLTCCGAAHDN